MPKQTGPLTEAGKLTSSQNALTHGMTSRQPLIQGEREEDRQALHRTWHEAFPAHNDYAARLVTIAADSEWVLRRVERSYDQTSAKLFLTPMPDWTPEDHAEYQRITRYLTTKQRALDRDRRTILQHRREVRAEAHFLQESLPAKESETQAPDALRDFDSDAKSNDPLEQYVTIAVQDGKTCTIASPGNEALLRATLRRFHHTPVARKLYFDGNHVPLEYQWCASRVAHLAEGACVVISLTVKTLPIAIARETDGHVKFWPDLLAQDEAIVRP